MDSSLANAITRLHGYLSGVVAMDGEIRQYTAEAFVVSGENNSDSPETMICDFYAAQTDIQFSGSQKLERGLGDLERQLGSYLIRRPWGLVDQAITQQLVEARRAFLAFRIMDIIADIAPEARNLSSVYKLEAGAPGSSSLVTFFCVRIDAGFLVLQFNDRSLSSSS